MEITLSTGSLDTSPSLLNTLSNLPEEVLYYKDHYNLRHPVAIFNISSAQIFKSFDKIIKSHKDYENQKNKNISDHATPIFDHHKDLLASVASFKESGFYIIKTLFKSDPNSDDRNVNLWIDKQIKKSGNKLIEKELLDLRKGINNYWSKHLLMNNLFKHNHARYFGFEMSGTYFNTLGYCIEEILAGDSAAPHKKIHSKFNNQYTAISFNKDIVYLLVSFYAVCDLFSKAIKNIVKYLHGIEIIDTLVENNNVQTQNLLEKAASYKRFYFPDEVKGKLPEIIISDRSIVLKDSSRKYSKMFGTIKSTYSFVGDGVTRTFSLPYK